MFRYQYLQVRNTYYRDIYSMCNTTVECNCINIQKNAAVIIKLLFLAVQTAVYSSTTPLPSIGVVEEEAKIFCDRPTEPQ